MLRQRYPQEEEHYPLSSIVNELIEKFHLVLPENEETANRNVKDLLRKKLKRTALSIPYEDGNLWDGTLVKQAEKEGEKEKHVFNSSQKLLLMDNSDLIDYLYNNSKDKNNDAIKELKENSDEARKLNEAAREMVKSGKAEPDNLFYYADLTESEELIELMALMIEALFLEKFEPIDKEVFFHDLAIAKSLFGDEHTPEIVAALKRYRAGAKTYVKRKAPSRKDAMRPERRF